MKNRAKVLEIAKEHMMEFVHPTNLNRFANSILEEAAQECETNGYDDAAKQIRKMKCETTTV